MDQKKLNRRNMLLGTATLAVAGGMVGFAFAMAPLYSIICEKLGWEGTTKRATAASVEITDMPITVRLDANTDKQLKWKFQPVERAVTLKLGETKTVFYRATNLSDEPTTGTATFNVTPEKTGQYFNKLECFCFQEQVLQPGQSALMGVTFFVDPALMKDVNANEVRTITLSYTFFRSTKTDSAQVDATKVTLAPSKGPATLN